MSSWRRVSLCVFATRRENNSYILLQDRTGIKRHTGIPLHNLENKITYSGEQYSLFGGGIENDETPLMAMQRELEEETHGIEEFCLSYIGKYDFEDAHTEREAHVYTAPMPDLNTFHAVEGAAWAMFDYEKIGSLYLPPGQHEILQSNKVRNAIMHTD